jgi:uncharacterized Zn finger protein (UPF0148 family)
MYHCFWCQLPLHRGVLDKHGNINCPACKEEHKNDSEAKFKQRERVLAQLKGDKVCQPNNETLFS